MYSQRYRGFFAAFYLLLNIPKIKSTAKLLLCFSCMLDRIAIVHRRLVFIRSLFPLVKNTSPTIFVAKISAPSYSTAVLKSIK